MTYSAPKIKKIVVNSGVGKMINARKGGEVTQGEEDTIKDLVSELSLITGQKPQILRAKKSIAGFKLRKGTISGVRVTLRGAKMRDFLSRLVNIAFPRSRDFSGLEKKAVDRGGNVTIGIKEQIIFPEIPHDKARKIWGMEVNIITSADNKEDGIKLLKESGVPFSK
jgi:large subunit ribosomal protein L5